jgi:hypothetical protein
MPVIKCSNGKWRIGTGPCMYKSEAKALKAYMTYLIKKREGKSGHTATGTKRTGQAKA